MNSVIINGKVLDFNYKKYGSYGGYTFYVGDIEVGHVIPVSRGRRWTAISTKRHEDLSMFDGFASRFDASEYLLQYNNIGRKSEIKKSLEQQQEVYFMLLNKWMKCKKQLYEIVETHNSEYERTSIIGDERRLTYYTGQQNIIDKMKNVLEESNEF